MWSVACWLQSPLPKCYSWIVVTRVLESLGIFLIIILNCSSFSQQASRVEVADEGESWPVAILAEIEDECWFRHCPIRQVIVRKCLPQKRTRLIRLQGRNVVGDLIVAQYASECFLSIKTWNKLYKNRISFGRLGQTTLRLHTHFTCWEFTYRWKDSGIPPLFISLKRFSSYKLY